MDRDPNNENPLSNWPRPLGFVLSGGGSYGATQVGMLKALLEAGITPDVVVGTSVGALNGSLFAAEPRESIDRLTEVWGSMTRAAVFGSRTRFGTAMAAIGNLLRRNQPGLCSPDGLRALIDEHLVVDRLEDLSTPTAIVVTDALVGRPKLLTQGLIGPALQASASIPGVFPPVEIDGCFYVDGGVSANVPIRQAVAFGAKSLVVLDANPAAMPGTLPHSVVGSVLHASMIMLRNQRADTTDHLVGRHPILHIPAVTPPTQNSFDFDNSVALIALGYTSTRDFLRRLPALTDATGGKTGGGQHGPPSGSEQPASPKPPPPVGRADRQSQAAPPPPSSPLKL